MPMEITEQNPPTPRPRPLRRRRRLILRLLAYALGALLVLAALAWALVKHECVEETVRRSDGKPVTVQTHFFRWRDDLAWSAGIAWKGGRIRNPGAYLTGLYSIGTLVWIMDEHGSFRWWSAQREKPVMVVDLDGGYVLARGPIFLQPGAPGLWLGPHGQVKPGYPPQLPIRRCVQNLGLTPEDRAILSDFDPEKLETLRSGTLSMWVNRRGGLKADYDPLVDSFQKLEEIAKETLETEFGGERDLTKVR